MKRNMYEVSLTYYDNEGNACTSGQCIDCWTLTNSNIDDPLGEVFSTVREELVRAMANNIAPGARRQ